MSADDAMNALLDAIDEAAREPAEDWEATERFPVSESARSRAKSLLLSLGDVLPTFVGWDAMGGIELGWDGVLDASVFDDAVMLVRSNGERPRTTVHRSLSEAVTAIRSIVKGGAK